MSASGMTMPIVTVKLQIFIDGRPLPVDPTPGWNGYSTAGWEDDTLVIQTASATICGSTWAAAR